MLLTTTQYRIRRRRLLHLYQVEKVLEDYQLHHREGYSIAYTWRRHIRDVHFISYECLRTYLGINTRKEIRELEEVLRQHSQGGQPKGLPAVFLLVLLPLLLLTGCGRSFAERCAAAFPTTADTVVRERVVQRTVRDTVLIPDSFIEYLDTTLCPPGLLDTLVIIRPVVVRVPGQVIEREVECELTVFDTVVRFQDAALVAGLRQDLAQLGGRLEEVKSGRARLRLWLAIMSLLFLGMLGLGLWQRYRRK